MKDSFDVVEDVKSLINIPDVLAHIDGKIWLFDRSGNSDKIDIVLNTIATSNRWMQQSVVNVNVYAPTIQVVINGRICPSPDRHLLYFLNSIIAPLLEAQYKFDFFTEIERPAFIRKDTNGSWYMNIRVKYRSINTNFKNI